MNDNRKDAAAFGRASPGGRGAALILICGLAAGTGHAQTAVAPNNSDAKADAIESAEDARDQILVVAHQQHGAVATEIPPEVTLGAPAIRALGAADLKEVF
ncbi:MAG TPA: hypothetical protein VGC10_08600, partial [Sphingomonas sp.]